MKLQVQAILVKMDPPGLLIQIRQNKVGLDFVISHGQSVYVLDMTQLANNRKGISINA